MKKFKVTIEGEDFYIDIDQAQKLGLLKQEPFIKDFNVGDLFVTKNGGAIIIVSCGYNSNKYSIAGLFGLTVFSNFGSDGGTKKQILEHLKLVHAKFVRNINSDVESLVEKFIGLSLNNNI